MLFFCSLLFFYTVAIAWPCEKSNPLYGTNACNTALSSKVRASAVVSSLKLEEKIGLFSNTWPGVPRLQIPHYQWWNEGLHGVALSPGVHFGGSFPCATSFPEPSLMAASFDVDLFEQVGDLVSTEARAMFNFGRAGLTYWAPNINVNRSPLWGRGQETPGEDPLLNGVYAAAFIRGMQGNDSASKDGLKVSACLKHFTAYSLENYRGVDRMHFDAEVSRRDLLNTYLPAFELGSAAGASCVMCSYNAVNGVPMCADAELLDLFRSKWSFRGYITSDCGAIWDVLHTHNFTGSPDATVSTVLGAGVDIDCGSFLDQWLPSAVRSTNSTDLLDSIDRALENQFSVLLRLGMFDDPSSSSYHRLGPANVNTTTARRLAYQAAAESIVLLKNDNNVLPITLKTPSIAVIGPSANATVLELGNYHGRPCGVVTALEGVRAEFPQADVVYSPGCLDVFCNHTKGFAEAIALAQSADFTIFVGGLDEQIAREGLDRKDLKWPGFQSGLIAKLAAVSKKN